MSVAEAYSATAGAWPGGPSRIYDHLSTVLVAACPGGVQERRVLDLGAGTGAATRAALAAGAAGVVTVDIATGMLAQDASGRPPGVVGDACRLPFATDSFGAVVAAFSLNHVARPEAGLVEAGRVLGPGGGLVVAAYAEDDTHPAKEAVEAACAAHGWSAAPWYRALKQRAMPRLATLARARTAAEAAGLASVEVANTRVPVPGLTTADLVAWRLGMAHLAPFVAALSEPDRSVVVADALDRLGSAPPPLVRSLVVLTAIGGDRGLGRSGAAASRWA